MIGDEAGILAADDAPAADARSLSDELPSADGLAVAGGAERLESLRRLGNWSRHLSGAADHPASPPPPADPVPAEVERGRAELAETETELTEEMGAPPGDPFGDAAGTRVLTAAEGLASLTMTVPAWLTGPTPGPRLSTTAVAALAEMALASAAGTSLRPGDLTVTTALQLRTQGPVAGWPDADDADEARPPASMFVPDPVAARQRERPVRLRAEASVAAGDGDEPEARLRRATATISTPDGRPLAEASAICAIVRPADSSPSASASPAPSASASASDAGTSAASHSAEPVGSGQDHPADPVPVGGVTAGSAVPGGPVGRASVSHLPPSHPLLGALGAEVHGDGDRLLLRLPPAGWLANRLGRFHAAACCALADAAVSTALTRRLPTGSAVHVLSLDLTVIRSLPLEDDVAAVATVRHVGRRLAVVDVELGPADAPPSVLARTMVALSAHHRSQP
ncbi:MULTISPECIES: PaaI family thioesterase [Pseudofrankia]|uniref:PaaI family thioesterase n=1 Tax=Pseudofrankia TaxID=2994363 RepID=UPI000234B23D|nr:MULTISPECIES: hotdog domain-containing protein [Pseudofrankia]OHV36632.1 hypothetical protein BCD49_18970 [Pseudofrankia sp. EUN1h]